MPYTITHQNHPDCADCETQATEAATIARATGSTGATCTLTNGDTDHGATVTKKGTP